MSAPMERLSLFVPCLGAGTTAWLAGLPPGRYRGDLAGLLASLGDAGAARRFLLAGACAALVLWLGSRWLRPGPGAPRPLLRELAPHLGWLGLPLLAPFLDPLAVSTTSVPLLAGGVVACVAGVAGRRATARRGSGGRGGDRRDGAGGAAGAGGPGGEAIDTDADGAEVGGNGSGDEAIGTDAGGAPATGTGAAVFRPARVAPAILALAAVAAPTLLAAPGPPWWQGLLGDEPHYLVLAHSLVADGDVDIGNDHASGSYRKFYPADLWPHGLQGHAPGTLYSIHGVGLAVYLAPWYALADGLSSHAFVIVMRLAMALWLGAAAVAVWLLAERLASRRAAVAAVLASVFTAPLLFAGAHLFTEVPALALGCGAWLLLRRRPAPGAAVAAGALLAVLPWLHFKYAVVSVVVAAAGLHEILVARDRVPGSRADSRPMARTSPAPAASSGRRWRRLLTAALLAVPLLTSALGHVAYTWSLYRRISPVSIQVGTGAYGEHTTGLGDEYLDYFAEPGGFVRYLAGFFTDQREGLLVYAPHYLLACAGLAWLFRRRRRDAVVLVSVLLALLLPYALAQTNGGWSPPARQVTGVLWALAVPLGIGLTVPAGGGRRGRLRAALKGGLLAWAVGMTLIHATHSYLLYHDLGATRSLVLQRYGAPGLSLTGIAPLWMVRGETRWALSLAWLAVIVAVAVFMARWGTEAARREAGPVTAPAVRQRSGGLSSGSTGGAESPAAREPAGEGGARHGAPGDIAWRAARATFLAGTVLLVAHHLMVPVSSLHQPFSFDEATVWIPTTPDQRAWPGERGFAVGGFDQVELLLSTPPGASLVTLEISAFAAQQVDVQLGRDSATLRLATDEASLARLRPGPGKRWGGAVFHPFRIRARSGVTPAALGEPSDDRTLGVYVVVVDVRD